LTIYQELGHNPVPPEDPSQEIKHYRRYFTEELENRKDILSKPTFNISQIKRGQSRGLSKSWFSFLSKPKTDESD